MNPAELRHKIADMVAELDTLIDNHEDVKPITRALLNSAANHLASAYLTVPGRFCTDNEQV